MWIKEEIAGPPIRVSPAMVAALVITLVGTIVFGLYPGPLFELAAASTQVLREPVIVGALFY